MPQPNRRRGFNLPNKPELRASNDVTIRKDGKIINDRGRLMLCAYGDCRLPALEPFKIPVFDARTNTMNLYQFCGYEHQAMFAVGADDSPEGIFHDSPYDDEFSEKEDYLRSYNDSDRP